MNALRDMSFIQVLGFVSSFALPFFNIPLIIRLYQRKSSEDLSLVWVLGVFVCMIGMLPAGLESKDLLFKFFSIANMSFFFGVVFLTLYYRMKKRSTS